MNTTAYAFAFAVQQRFMRASQQYSQPYLSALDVRFNVIVEKTLFRDRAARRRVPRDIAVL